MVWLWSVPYGSKHCKHMVLHVVVICSRSVPHCSKHCSSQACGHDIALVGMYIKGCETRIMAIANTIQSEDH